jgi:hypothetical protein
LKEFNLEALRKHQSTFQGVATLHRTHQPKMFGGQNLFWPTLQTSPISSSIKDENRDHSQLFVQRFSNGKKNGCQQRGRQIEHECRKSRFGTIEKWSHFFDQSAAKIG